MSLPRPGIWPTVITLVVAATAALGATRATDAIYSFAGRPASTQRLNPVLVQPYPVLPPAARPWVIIGAERVVGRSVLEIGDGRVTVTSPQAWRAPRLDFQFLAPLRGCPPADMYVTPLRSRAFLSVGERSGEGCARVRVTVDDPYPGEGVHDLVVWFHAGE